MREHVIGSFVLAVAAGCSGAVAVTPPPPRPISTQCVLHAGGGKGSSSRQKAPDGGLEVAVKRGSCWFNAECIRMPGNAQPGDGFVSLTCTDDACECTLEPIGEAAVKESFRYADVCTDGDAASHLLVERCMSGMARPKKDP